MRSERALRLLLGALGLLGVAISAYLTTVHFSGEDPVCLAGGGGCTVVQDSEYAELAGIPVPVIGLAGYLTILLAAALPGDSGRFGGLFAGIVGFGFSVYLTYLELFEIEAICQWCVASAVLMTLILIAAAWRALRYGGLPAGPAATGGDRDDDVL